MSNGIRHDSLLVRYLAEEVGDRLRGRRAASLRLDPDRRVAALETDDATLVFELHPLRGYIRIAPAPAAPQILRFHRRATIAAVTAPPDERLLFIDLAGPVTEARPLRRLVVELMTNQWNLLALADDGRIVAALRPRDAGGRRLRTGAVYAPPPTAGRAGVDSPVGPDAWRELLEPVPPTERARTLVRQLAWTSPLNARAILGDAGGGDAVRDGGDAAAMQDSGGAREAGGEEGTALSEAYARYVELAGRPAAAPCVLRGGQPYPLRLWRPPAEPAASLLGAMAAAAGEEADASAAAAVVAPETLARLRARIGRLDDRADALRRELEGAAPEADRLRHLADLLLSQLHRVPKGAHEAALDDFEGGSIRLTLDPALSPSDNAARLYDRARRRERAAERLPQLVERIVGRREKLAALLERAAAGEVGEDDVASEIGEERPPADASGAEEAVPYRRYRTSGGLDVRVGRGARSNDELTFHHSSPNDVWLHARDVGGAHVILRWNDPSANPPARDLHEAAALAALHSRARGSGTVPVDWTRRKHVRKPRKAPAGLVAPDRVKTVFVQPSPALEQRLRHEH